MDTTRTFRGLVLDDFQVKAIEALDRGESVLVTAPTGAGKTLIAEYAIEKCIAEGKRIIYTSPIKALSNQKFRDFLREHGDTVGIVTGDVSVHPHARILIMTTEIFRNTLFDDPARLADVEYVIFDEIHYLSDPERGTVWEESIIFAPPSIKIIALSATIPNHAEIVRWIETIRGTRLTLVIEETRPVPLRHRLFVESVGITSPNKLGPVLQKLRRGWDDDRRHRSRFDRRHRGDRRDDRRGPPAGPSGRGALLDHLAKENELPCLYFLFNRTGCEERAWESRHRALLPPEATESNLARFDTLAERFSLARDRTTENLRLLVGRGIAYHHAGMLPSLKEIVEVIFSEGAIRLLFATETFALGVNMPARSVVVDSLVKFDGVQTVPLRCREYHQMAGRAGRRGMDEAGTAYARIDRNAPEERTVLRILEGNLERVESQLNLSYATVLNLHERLGKRIFEISAKSLASFTGRVSGGSAADDEASDRRLRRRIRQLERLITGRLAVLKELGCLDDAGVTEKGRLARRVNGYELVMAEIVTRGIPEGLDASRLAAAAASVVYEARRGTFHRRLKEVDFQDVRVAIETVAGEIHDLEDTNRVYPCIRIPDFRIASAAWLWCQEGVEFNEVRQLTSASDGDIVRTFRMTVQLLRQTAQALADTPWARYADTFRAAMKCLKRGEVDAEWQLMAGE
ncbi:MAG: DEAD/DEAH box helicase [Planctomycetota bacterium]